MVSPPQATRAWICTGTVTSRKSVPSIRAVRFIEMVSPEVKMATVGVGVIALFTLTSTLGGRC